MQIARTIDAFRSLRHADATVSWGFVPTMGYLHEGHLGLVRRARADNDRIAVSIFVNPTQFAPNEDYESYPVDHSRDLALLEREGVDVVFIPPAATIYPPMFQTFVNVREITQVLEGASRPTHFEGVTTVVAKLFNIVEPHRAYFGQKDAQQVVVIKRMVEDLNFNLAVVVCPTAREEDGLAMSSRNVRLSQAERKAAPVLFRALSSAKEAIGNGEKDAENLRASMRALVGSEPLARLDYISIADPHTLEELDKIAEKALLSGAIFVGDVRLIDNILI